MCLWHKLLPVKKTDRYTDILAIYIIFCSIHTLIFYSFSPLIQNLLLIGSGERYGAVAWEMFNFRKKAHSLSVCLSLFPPFPAFPPPPPRCTHLHTHTQFVNEYFWISPISSRTSEKLHQQLISIRQDILSGPALGNTEESWVRASVPHRYYNLYKHEIVPKTASGFINR